MYIRVHFNRNKYILCEIKYFLGERKVSNVADFYPKKIGGESVSPNYSCSSLIKLKKYHNKKFTFIKIFE
jgi:hypothetical protein